MSRKFRVNASRKPVKCKMSDEEFYTRDFPSVAAGKVVVKPQRGNWTVFIGLSDGTIAYQWCESKEKAQREAKYARDTIKRYGADDSYWAAEGYKIWNPNVKSSTRPAKRKSTIKASAGDDYITITFLYNGNSDDERAKAVTEEAWRLGGFGSTGTEHGKATVMVPLDQDVRKIEQLVLFAEDQGIYLNQYSYNLLCDKFQFDKYLRDGVTGSKSVKCSAKPAKRKSTIKADALSDFRKDWTERIFDRNYPSEKIEVHFKDGRAAQYTAAVLDRMMSDPDIDYIIDAITGELLYESEHGDVRGSKSVKCSARPVKRKTTIKANTAPYNFSRDDRYALAGEVLYRAGIANNEHGAAVAYYMPGDYTLTFNHEQNEMQSSDLIFTLWNPSAEHENDFAGILYVDLNSAQSGEDATEVFYRPNGLGSLGEWKQFDDFKSAVDWLIANAPDRELFRVDSSQDVECSEDIMCWVDPAEARFMVDLMYGKDSGYAEDRYFGADEWSEVEAFAHDGLMRGLYARIWDKQTGDTITISPDEYAEAWENGAADFDINEDIVNFKNRVVTSSTKIQGVSNDNALAIFRDGQFVYRNELGREFAEQLEYIFERDEDALAAAIEYLNSFGDPLIDDPAATPKEVATTMTEWIGMEWSDDGDDFEADIPTASGRLEIYPASQTIDLEWAESGEHIDASTKIEAFRDDTVDETAVRELVLVITNDGDLYRQRTTPIIENLKKKAEKGTYDREKAVKLWQYLADDGVRMYDKEYGSGRGSVAMLNPATRRRIAEELRDYYEEQIMWDINHKDDDSELTTM